MLPSNNHALRLARSLVGNLLNSLALLDHLSSNKSDLIYRSVGSQKVHGTDRYVLFSRFSKEPRFSKNEISIFKTLSQSGWTISVTSNSPIEESEILNAITVGVNQVNLRGNRGMDFAAHRDSISRLPSLESADELLLLNDSMVWNVPELEYLLTSKFKELPNGVLGLTDSRQRKWHIQSYFVFAKGNVEVKQILLLSNYWRNWRFKRTVVKYGEIGSSQLLLKNEVKILVLYKYDDLVQLNMSNQEYRALLAENVNMNSTQHFWKTLLMLSFPGVKKSLIRNNPARLRDTPDPNLINTWENFENG